MARSKSRKLLWDALDAVNATTALANYAATGVDIAAVEADIVTANGNISTANDNISTANDDIAALELKSNIVASKAANNTTVVKAFDAMPDTVGTCKVVDELGATVGYIAYYANATLT